MDLRLLFVAILNFETMIYSLTSTLRLCYFGYCYGDTCVTAHCYADIVCGKGTTINIITVQYSAHSQRRNIYIKDCKNACYGTVVYNLTYTNTIEVLCNGQEKCSIRKRQTDLFWELEVTFECKAVTETAQRKSHTFPSSTGTITYQLETTADSEQTSTSKTDALTSPTPSTAPGNDSSTIAESETCNSSSSERFPLTAIALSIAAGIVVLVIVVVSIVCIKRRKANKESIDNIRVQCDGRKVNTLSVTNIGYDETKTAARRTEPNDHYEQAYEFVAAHIAITTTNENEYNNLNETCRPPNADPNYDHIPRQSTSRENQMTTKTDEDIYNTLHKNTNCKGLNDDPNYDHVSTQSPSDDQTYSHIKAGKYVRDKPKYQVYETNMYSHLKQCC